MEYILNKTLPNLTRTFRKYIRISFSYIWQLNLLVYRTFLLMTWVIINKWSNLDLSVMKRVCSSDCISLYSFSILFFTIFLYIIFTAAVTEISL